MLLTLLCLGFSDYFVPDRIVQSLTAESRVVTGQTFLTATAATAALEASLDWNPKSGVATVFRDGYTAAYRLGSRSATVNGKFVRLQTPPFKLKGEIMLPIRHVSAALHVPLRFEARTTSLLIGHGPSLRALALPSRKTGFVIFTPLPDSMATKRIRVRGQANVEPGQLKISICDAQGKVLTSDTLTTAHGRFGEFVYDYLSAKSVGGEERLTVNIMQKDKEVLSIPVLFRYSE